ncbi:hypothetical protein A2631_03670 [Candidatus Daviesbacteria bacterium RIFCSPHIGHO2_01_FULL_44_29]|uniref:NADP-dependent oxidoreductase domain-containing protein n=1 Tax=Candidatus Daviesbacteria bacterium RIFCSPHIGHO2_02_FULL_43_12 TaxID=1797776 RepID=A0A1F5KHU1_9BACT|nr:MAG: hypothetical protein A2631_03670 [Candidatus Daviesbacteria bacterium RIFCSPHIGHO2_01_FULL_44_29]OGE39826.1 MAG: hypothetical protein A3E86_04635 [Candidatus Daviesbacteria bacterium RIFCSPHIGHO2_12_FULL_47_45]OGE40458.1 MAG: hypothetical protein A3D25_00130 [Candidatus Daviesbacteria bacterium RIFCSPHIGHO2_02_FULL_43_12]OGE70009.1 MAG: hypothetical protein A3B55_04935 [Candidatus Daviesbacteria bacterium RIFCSPLOWO2_01_FULL_43_15]
MMHIPTKKLKNGFIMPVFGLGTWNMGGKSKRGIARDDQADILAIKTAIELGVTHLDTAESYNDEEIIYAEELIGQAIRDFNRKDLFIVSKVSFDFSYNGIMSAVQDSLRRLQTDYLDLYLLHTHKLEFPLRESLHALDELVERGLIKNIGVSNFLPESLKEAQSLTKNKIVCNQVHYNLVYREPEDKGLVNYCQKEDVFLVAWSPLERGALMETPPMILKEMAEKYHKTPAQISLNWLISQDKVTAIAKTRSIEHLKENLGAVGWEMDREDIEKLRLEFPNQQVTSSTSVILS